MVTSGTYNICKGHETRLATRTSEQQGPGSVRLDLKKGPRTHQLIPQAGDGFEAELSVAEVEEISKRWAKKIEKHGLVV